MIKRTIYFGNPVYLSTKRKQLVIKYPEVVHSNLPDELKNENIITLPIEDIAYVVLDCSRITITHGLLESLLANNVVLLMCNSSHMPTGLMLPLYGNVVHNERVRNQLEVSSVLKKRLWKQTVQAKICNQGTLLSVFQATLERKMLVMASQVTSGDLENVEAQAAAFYWKKLFGHIPDFIRRREGIAPNFLLNYGYAILRAIVARALVSSGLLLVLGIHHRNKYNPYCLADDIMEPYRPFVDQVVYNLASKQGIYSDELTKETKSALLDIPTLDVTIDGNRRPLMVAVTQTTSSLYRCYTGESRKIIFPTFENLL